MVPVSFQYFFEVLGVDVWLSKYFVQTQIHLFKKHLIMMPSFNSFFIRFIRRNFNLISNISSHFFFFFNVFTFFQKHLRIINFYPFQIQNRLIVLKDTCNENLLLVSIVMKICADFSFARFSFQFLIYDFSFYISFIAY